MRGQALRARGPAPMKPSAYRIERRLAKGEATLVPPPRKWLRVIIDRLLLRKFVRSPMVQSALQHSSDKLLAFTLRAVELVIVDQSRTDREMIGRLWDILLNNPHLIQAVGPQNSLKPR